MKNIKYILIGFLLTPLLVLGAWTTSSIQIGTSPSNGKVLQTDGTNSAWVATSTLGITSSQAEWDSFWNASSTLDSVTSIPNLTGFISSVLNAGSILFGNGSSVATQLASSTENAVLEIDGNGFPAWTTSLGSGAIPMGTSYFTQLGDSSNRVPVIYADTVRSQWLEVSNNIIDSSLKIGSSTNAVSADLVFENTGGSGTLSLTTGNLFTLDKGITITGTATSTNLDVTGNSKLGTVISGLWNGTAIGELYGGTGATSFGTAWDNWWNASTTLDSVTSIPNLSLALDGLSDVIVPTPAVDEILKWNGSSWINGAGVGASASPGIEFFNATPTITASSTNGDLAIFSLSKTPIVTAEQTVSGTANTNTVAFVAWLYNTAMGRTTIDAGTWSFDTYVAVDSVLAGRVTTLTRQIYTARPFVTGTLTTTGSGTSRTATASAGTPFVTTEIDASATNTTASYLQTPQGLYQITARASDTEVTITVPTTYVNEVGVSASVWKKLFGSTSPTITATGTNYSLSSWVSTQGAFTITTADKLGAISFVTSNNTTTLTLTYNGTARNTHFETPLITMHNNLAGLNGGASNEYYHLTSAEYTGTGTGVFARSTSPVFTTPNIGTATGSITGNSGTATILATARSIFGNSFNGSADLSGIIASTYGGTGNGFTKFSGATGSEKTYTLPDANATLLYSGGALGTPSSGTLSNATGLPISTGVSGLGTNVATFLATPSSANLASAVTGGTGSGALVFGTSPAFTTQISTPSIVTASGALGITPTAGSNLNINLSTTGDLAVNTNQLYVDTSTGNVGIGTTNPGAKLEVMSSTQAIAGDLIVDTTNGAPVVTIGRLSGTGGDTTRFIVRNRIGTELLKVDPSSAVLSYMNGNVGIGTTSPDYLLHLVSSSVAEMELKGSTAAEFDFYETSGTVDQRRGRLTIDGGKFSLEGLNDADTTITQNLFSGDLANGRVGIGTVSPSARLQVASSSSLVFDGTDSSTFNNVMILQNTDNPGQGANTMMSFYTGGANVNNAFGIVQQGSGGPADFVWAAYNGSVFAERMRLTANGSVGLGDTSPDYGLDVVTDINSDDCFREAGAQVAGTCASDERLKENIIPIESSLAKILKLNPVTFDWKRGIETNPGIRYVEGTQTGLIAQEVEKIFPEWVSEKNGFKAVEYNLELQMRLIKAIQEQQKEINEIKGGVIITKVVRSAEENYQNILIGILFVYIIYNEIDKRRIKLTLKK